MKPIIAAAVAAFAFVPVACKESSEGGSPGTPSTFTFVGPATGTTLKPGESKAVEVSLNRGSDFKRGVAFSVKGTDSVDAEVDPKAAKENESPKVNVKLTAKADAREGDHKVVLTGTPEGGGAATNFDITVTVKK
jgi:uncharacterized membrane protein